MHKNLEPKFEKVAPKSKDQLHNDYNVQLSSLLCGSKGSFHTREPTRIYYICGCWKEKKAKTLIFSSGQVII